MKTLLGDFNPKKGRENIFKTTIGNDSVHRDSNDNGVRIVDYATTKNIFAKITMFSHQNIHTYTWTSPEGKTHNQTDHILIARRRHSSVFDVRSFRRTYCDTDHYLVVANVRERLAVNKQAAQNFDVERFNFRKLNDLTVRKQYQIKLSKRFADLENLIDTEEINRAWENIKENIKI
jgi:hypothetical protein